MTQDERLVGRVKEELTPIDMEARFSDMLDNCYSFKGVGGPFEHMQPSRVLQEVDPTAFRCGVVDMWDETVEEIDGEVYDTEEVQAIRDAIAMDAENAIEAEGEED